MISKYMLFTFTDFVPQPEVKYINGWIMIAALSTLLGFNMAVISSQTIAANINMIRLRIKRRRNRLEFEKRKREQ